MSPNRCNRAAMGAGMGSGVSGFRRVAMSGTTRARATRATNPSAALPHGIPWTRLPSHLVNKDTLRPPVRPDVLAGVCESHAGLRHLADSLLHHGVDPYGRTMLHRAA